MPFSRSAVKVKRFGWTRLYPDSSCACMKQIQTNSHRLARFKSKPLLKINSLGWFSSNNGSLSSRNQETYSAVRKHWQFFHISSGVNSKSLHGLRSSQKLCYCVFWSRTLKLQKAASCSDSPMRWRGIRERLNFHCFKGNHYPEIKHDARKTTVRVVLWLSSDGAVFSVCLFVVALTCGSDWQVYF